MIATMPSIVTYWYKYSHEGVRIEQISNEVSVAAHFLKLLRQEEISDLHKRH